MAHQPHRIDLVGISVQHPRYAESAPSEKWGVGYAGTFENHIMSDAEMAAWLRDLANQIEQGVSVKKLPLYPTKR